MQVKPLLLQNLADQWNEDPQAVAQGRGAREGEVVGVAGVPHAEGPRESVEAKV